MGARLIILANSCQGGGPGTEWSLASAGPGGSGRKRNSVCTYFRDVFRAKQKQKLSPVTTR